MDVEEAIAIIDAVLGANGLSDIQEQIFREVWAREKYPDIAETLGYDANYIKDLGAKIWKQLSVALGEKVTKSSVQSVLRRHRILVTVRSAKAEQDPSTLSQSFSSNINAGERLDTSAFIGRAESLERLSHWLQDDKCRLLALIGVPGIGKTSLAAKLTASYSKQFDSVIWRSLEHRPSVPQIVQDLLSTRQLSPLPDSTPEEQTSQLLQDLSQHPCLIILDNVEAVLPSSSMFELDQPSIQAYQRFLEQLGRTGHHSTVIITCREKPHFWSALEGTAVQSLNLPPLNPVETAALLEQKGPLMGTSSNWQALTDQYGGNPLALQIVATNILDFFQGNISDFLAEGQVVFAGLSVFLQRQWAPLSSGERWVLYYLAMRREAVTFKALKDTTLDFSLQRRLTEILATLERRSLIQRHHSYPVTFGLQTAVLEYVTFHLIEKIGNELARSLPNLLHQLPLRTISSQDFIQASQQQHLLQPILDYLKDAYSNQAQITQHLKALLSTLQRTASDASYAPGNIVNLLLELNPSITVQDLSHLPLWDVNLASTPLHNVNLNHCDLSRTVFAYAFGGVISVAFRSQGADFLTGHENGNITLWNDQGQALHRLTGHQNWVWDLVCTPNGEWAVSASEDQTLRVWTINTGDCLRILQGHGDRIWRVVCPQDDIAVSSSSDQTLKVWDLNTGTCLQTLTGHEGDITALEVVPSMSQVLSGGADQSLRLWDWATGETLEVWNSEQGGIWAIAYCETTQTIYSAGDRGIIEVWTRGQPEPIRQLGSATSRIWALALSPCERYLVAGGESCELVRWDLQLNTIDRIMPAQSKIWAVDYASSGETIIAASEDNHIQLWNIDQGQPRLKLSSYSNWGCDVTMVPQSSLVASAYGDGNLYLWNQAQGTLKHCLQGHQTSAWAIASNSTGTLLVSGSEDHTLRIWEIETGTCQGVLKGHQRQIWSVAWSPDGETIASGSGDRSIKLWAPSGHCQRTLCGHQSRVWTVAWSPDGEMIASGSSDRSIKLWDRTSGDCVVTLNGHQSLVLSVAFHPSEPKLASVGGDGTCKLWDLESHLCIETIPSLTKMNWAVAWSPDGTLLAMAGDDGIIRLWNDLQKDWTQTLSVHQSCIWAIAFSADGNQLYSSSQDGTTRVWELATEHELYCFQPKRLYEGLNIIDATGLTPAQIQNLETLGAKA